MKENFAPYIEKLAGFTLNIANQENELMYDEHEREREQKKNFSLDSDSEDEHLHFE